METALLKKRRRRRPRPRIASTAYSRFENDQSATCKMSKSSQEEFMRTLRNLSLLSNWLITSFDVTLESAVNRLAELMGGPTPGNEVRADESCNFTGQNLPTVDLKHVCDLFTGQNFEKPIPVLNEDEEEQTFQHTDFDNSRIQENTAWLRRIVEDIEAGVSPQDSGDADPDCGDDDPPFVDRNEELDLGAGQEIDPSHIDPDDHQTSDVTVPQNEAKLLHGEVTSSSPDLSIPVVLSPGNCCGSDISVAAADKIRYPSNDEREKKSELFSHRGTDQQPPDLHNSASKSEKAQKVTDLQDMECDSSDELPLSGLEDLFKDLLKQYPSLLQAFGNNKQLSKGTATTDGPVDVSRPLDITNISSCESVHIGDIIHQYCEFPDSCSRDLSTSMNITNISNCENVHIGDIIHQNFVNSPILVPVN